MQITDNQLEQVIEEIALLEVEHIDEALLVCEDALQRVSSANDRKLVLLVSYNRARFRISTGQNEGLAELLESIISECHELNDMDTLARAYNLQGTYFADYGLFDRSLESYMSGLKISERIELPYLIGNIANNIGNLYYELEEFTKAASYFERALESLDTSTEDSRTAGLQGILLLNIGDIHGKHKDYAQARIYCDKAKALFELHKWRQLLAHAFALEAVIYVGENLIDKAYETYKECIEIYLDLNDKRDVVLAAVPFISAILEHNQTNQTEVDYEKILEILLECESYATGFDNQKTLCDMHHVFAEVYHQMGNLQSAIKHYRLFESHRRTLDEERRQQQLNVLNLRFEIEKSIEEKEIVQQKNDELREKSEELLSKKEALELAYQRIQVISEIGQKVTSTLDLNEILISVYDNLRSQMPIDSFYMAVLNDEHTHLVSVASVENLVYEKAFEIPIDHKNSLLAISYRDCKTLFIPDILQEPSMKEWDLIRSSELSIRSIIVVPLLYNEEVVGVCSVQSIIANGYGTAHLDILNALSTYLAIAINNAKKSKRLEQEIQMRLRTQKELERLNTELRSISEIDGLTKVPNRRRFENVYDQMFEIALSQSRVLNVLMMDIDYFKVYNDHYGHLKGDEVLIAVAQKLNQAFRFKGRLFARYGGEEFVAVLSDMEREDANVLAQELRIAVSNLGIFHELSPTGFLTISIGLASMVPRYDNDLRRLLHAADESLYKAKHNGRNRVETVEVFPEEVED